jgi:hypothetical protein
MNKRFIKKENFNYKNIEISTLPENKSALHPISLVWFDNNKSKDEETPVINPMCLTKFNIDNEKKLNFKSNYKCKTDVDNYKKFLFIPPIGLTSDSLLQIYNIESIDSLQSWVKDNLDSLTYFTINRIINCWIRTNFDTLRMYNNFLEKIYILLINKFKIGNIYEKIQSGKIDINKEIKDFIDYWIGKKEISEFNFDLYGDLINYLQKKYK